MLSESFASFDAFCKQQMIEHRAKFAPTKRNSGEEFASLIKCMKCLRDSPFYQKYLPYKRPFHAHLESLITVLFCLDVISSLWKSHFRKVLRIISIEHWTSSRTMIPAKSFSNCYLTSTNSVANFSISLRSSRMSPDSITVNSLYPHLIEWCESWVTQSVLNSKFILALGICNLRNDVREEDRFEVTDEDLSEPRSTKRRGLDRSHPNPHGLRWAAKLPISEQSVGYLSLTFLVI